MQSPDDRTEVRPQEDVPTLHVPAAAPLRPDQLTPGTVLGGRYRVVSLIGTGGMGAVYRGDDLRLGQPIAMKFLSRRSSEVRERMLYDEVRIGRQISHPNVCRLYDIAEVDGQIFITMEYVDGEDLASLLRRVGRLPPDRAAAVARDLCAGLAAAHELGVVHRDLKPANVMIDGRGRARITDFGLAVATDVREQNSAGTPAYMAPEQLAGGRATEQSDLYALGLVLYEVFTGKRVFSGGSVTDILEQQRTAQVVPPSQIVKDIDPRIERTILSCLDPDPARRPASVTALMQELPSFDPLAAAVAAGETPSPEMVAAASERGDLRAAVAWTLLAVSVVSLAIIALVSGRTQRIGTADIKPPEVLLERTRSLLTWAGLTQPPRDSGWYYVAGERRDVLFVYRQSPRPMAGSRLVDPILFAHDPPLTASGMVSVTMDGAGKLRELAIVPPQREAPRPGARADFATLLQHAGLDPLRLTAVAPEWAAPVDSDEKRAWLDRSRGTRIEAAAYHGRPVWFAVLEPWTKPARMTPRSVAAPQRVADVTTIALLLVLPMAILLIGIRNLRRGRGDRRGATRVALVVFAALLAAYALRSHHPSGFLEEWQLASRLVAGCAFWAGIMWLAYVALEPLVRRRWPRMLISWSRLVDGRWSDPMVGRDVLVGTAAGALIALAGHAGALLGDPVESAVTPIGSTRHVLFFVLRSPAEAIGRTLFAAVLLVAVRAVVRRIDVAFVVCTLVVALGNLGLAGGPLPVRVAWSVLAGAAAFALLLRFGVLTLTAAAGVILPMMQMPLTSDPSSWWFARSLVAFVLPVALALTGFRLSLGGNRALPRLDLD